MLRYFLCLFVLLASIQGQSIESIDNTQTVTTEKPFSKSPSAPTPGEAPDGDFDEDEKDFEDDFFTRSSDSASSKGESKYDNVAPTNYKSPFLGRHLRPPRS